MQNKNCMLGVDIGSSNMKVVFIDDNGIVLGSASYELNTIYSHDSWSEQDPLEWEKALSYCVHDIFYKKNCNINSLGAISITAAAHTPVLLDKNDQILRPAILWTDRRSTKECDYLNEKFGDLIYKIAFHKPSPTWTLPQLLWLKNNEPEVYEKIDRLLVAKDYLRYRLTEIWETDVVDAQGTMMFDYEKNCWSKEICDIIGWDMKKLPPIKNTLDVAGRVSSKASKMFALPEGVPVIVGGSDTAVEDYGAGAIEHEQGILKIATAGNANIMSHTPHRHPALFNYRQVMPDLWYIAAGTLSGAQVHKWIRDQLFTELAASYENKQNAFSAIDKLAENIDAGSNGLIFHPYLLGEKTPYMDPFLRGDFLGLTIRHSRAHLVRALYEGISFSLLDCLNVHRELGLEMSDIRLIGGGAKSSLWRQILCNVVGKKIFVPENNEAAFGAALVAGVGAKIFSDAKTAITKCARISITHEPDMKQHEKYQKVFELYIEAQRKLVDINHKLYALEMNK